MSDYPISSPSGNNVVGYLPKLYESSRFVRSTAQAEGAELDRMKEALNGVLEQYFVDTATWGLELWEDELGLTSTPDKPDSERRSVIKSKLRGVGSVTVQLMKTVAEAYDQGAIDVTQQPALYQFTVKFVDTIGAPPNLDDLKAAIEEIKPAHLQVVYEYKYLLINQIHQTMTINELQARKLSDFSPVLPV